MSLPHRWSLDVNYTLGLTLGEWWALLRENGFAVDGAYMHRAVAITAMGCWNSSLAALERIRLGAPDVEVPPPIFVIGHWRSGTTFLYQLLATDPRYAFLNAYQAVNPHNFRVSERLGSRLFGGLVPARRPPDAVALGFDLPEQDEYVLALAARTSPYLGHVFPRNADFYERFVTMEDATPEERERFARVHRDLLRKLAAVHGRPAILKSPAHTGRIRLLRQIWPDARFVFVHRDPFTVFRSTLNLYETLHWYWYLQRPDPATFEARILDRYVTLHEAYLDALDALPPGTVTELAYADLVADPESTLERAYGEIGLEPFDGVREPLRARLAGLSDYRTNRYEPLEPALRARIAERWAPIYSRWGYAG